MMRFDRLAMPWACSLQIRLISFRGSNWMQSKHTNGLSFVAAQSRERIYERVWSGLCKMLEIDSFSIDGLPPGAAGGGSILSFQRPPGQAL